MLEVGVDWDLIFFGYCQCSNFLVHKICTKDFQGFIDQESHFQLFASLSVQDYTVRGAAFIFFNWVCFWFLHSADVNFFSGQDYFDVVEFWYYSAYIPISDWAPWKSHCWRFWHLACHSNLQATLTSVPSLQFTLIFTTWLCHFSILTIFSEFFHYQQWTIAEPSLSRDGRHEIDLTINGGLLEWHHHQWIALESQYGHVQALILRPIGFTTIGRECCF